MPCSLWSSVVHTFCLKQLNSSKTVDPPGIIRYIKDWSFLTADHSLQHHWSVCYIILGEHLFHDAVWQLHHPVSVEQVVTIMQNHYLPIALSAQYSVITNETVIWSLMKREVNTWPQEQMFFCSYFWHCTRAWCRPMHKEICISQKHMDSIAWHFIHWLHKDSISN